MYCQVLAEWAARVRDVCDASHREEAGCFLSGERVRGGNRPLSCQLSGLKEVGDVKKEFLGEVKR